MPGSNCRSCGAEIIWGETAKGKRMPLDPTPVPDARGNGVQVMFEGLGGSAQVRPYDAAVEEIALRRKISTQAARDHIEQVCDYYVSHFSTCPEAGHFRRGRR